MAEGLIEPDDLDPVEWEGWSSGPRMTRISLNPAVASDEDVARVGTKLKDAFHQLLNDAFRACGIPVGNGLSEAHYRRIAEFVERQFVDQLAGMCSAESRRREQAAIKEKQDRLAKLRAEVAELEADLAKKAVS
jgi:hypothetical protein